MAASSLSRAFVGAVLIVLLVLPACVKRVERNVPGRGGLPSGIVHSGPAPVEVNPEWPVYPGSVSRATGVYETSDLFQTVVSYYTQLLGIEPAVGGQFGETRIFAMPGYTLILFPMTPSGTEIHFEDNENGSGTQ